MKAFILRKKGLLNEPRTLGEHLRNRRLSLGLRQVDVAGHLGTLREVYDRWERDERVPVVSEWPGIVSFLGYYPCPQGAPAVLVLKARRCRGADQKSMASAVGVIHQELRSWEHDQALPSEAQLERLKEIAREVASICLPASGPGRSRLPGQPQDAEIVPGASSASGHAGA